MINGSAAAARPTPASRRRMLMAPAVLAVPAAGTDPGCGWVPGARQAAKRLARRLAWLPIPTSVSLRAYQRNSRPRPAPPSALMPMTMAACAAAGPVGRSCA